MQDIIAILRSVWQGLDQLQVRGVDNAQLLGSCADGVNAAIRGLLALQTAEQSTVRESGQPGETEAANG